MAVDVTAALPGGDPTRFIRNEPDEALVAMVLQGSEAAFEAIYDRHHRGLIAFCRHMLRSREEAEDALQHTFAAAYRSLTGGGDRPAALKPWLYAIARNRCLTVLRARKTRDEAADAEAPSDGAVVEGLTDAVQRRADLRDLVADLHRLPEDQRAAIVLFEMGDQSHAEIADVLDINREKVKALVFQAREGLMRARTARDTPCAEIRRHLSSRTRALPRRGVIRGHLDCCAACAAYDLEVRRQRAALAIALPVVPSLELKSSVLGPLIGGGATVAAGGAAAIGTGAAGTIAATGTGAVGAAGAGTAGGAAAIAAGAGAGGGLTGGAAMGGLGALAANAVVAKVVTVVAVAGAAAGAGHAINARHDAKPHRAPSAKSVVVANSKPAPPSVISAPAPPARQVGAESTTVVHPQVVTETQTVAHSTPATGGSSPATTATTPTTPATSPAANAHPTAADPSAPAAGGTAAGGTSAPASDPAAPADGGASGSAASTSSPPDTGTPPAGSEPTVVAEELPPDNPAAAGTAVDPATGAPVSCPPGTGPASTDPNAAPAPASTDPATAPPVPTVTLPDGTVTPIPAGCALLPAAAGTTAQDPAISATAVAATADAPPTP